MVDVSTIPQNFNITHYAGDTLTIRVTAQAGIADGLTWAAHIKSSRASAVPDAAFTIIPPPTPGDPAYLVLPSAESERLIGAAVVVQLRAPDGSLYAITRYTGFWDCQVSDAGSDPVITLVQGSFTLDIDVTRV